ncbi:glycosyltransferase family 32 protein [Saccharata proteae CBS 121410]|uniref:Glycosyltransferase family 32 protein n=1 Tax=Saccharata proteae CBS 121410 TaxID=1314787 RepID=A0A9P4HRV2_9PEZI|nr:glycosyltransferase family 32 protein [Saccharata proteae CBS 121410]
MLTFRRALVVAAAVLTFFFILRSSHSAPSAKIPNPLPKPVSTEETLARAKQEAQEVSGAESSRGNQSPVWKSESTGIVAQPIAKKPRPQIALDDLKEKPLRQQLEYQFPYDPYGKFPGYIWQTWKSTPASGDFDEIFREPEASWTILHPTFVHEVITDSVAVHLMRHLYASVPAVLEAYNALPLPVLKADFFRYLILLARGGIYSDIDTAALKPATDWVPPDVPRNSYGLVIGIEADPDREDWAEWYSRRIQFCQWTIQAKPGHPVLREIVANITEETLARKRQGRLSKDDVKGIVEFTGPALWTDVVFGFFNDPEYFEIEAGSGSNITWEAFTGMTSAKKVGDVIVLPITSFSPGVRQMGAGEDDDPMAFVKHNFEGGLMETLRSYRQPEADDFPGTWKPENERHIGE